MPRYGRRVSALVAVGALILVACEAERVAAPDATPDPPGTPAPGGDPGEEHDPDEDLDAEEPREAYQAAPLPGPRTEVTGTAWGGRIITVGGLDEDGAAMSDVHIYDPATDSLDAGPDLPEPLHHTAVVVLDDRVHVVGGYTIRDGSWVALAEVWSLGESEDAWREEPPLGTPRGALAVAATEERLVAIGGVGTDGSVLTSTEILEAGAGGWEPGPELATPREHLAATAVGGEVYAIAGRAGGFATNRASVEVLRDDAWHDAGDLNASRGGIGAATVDGVPCVTGGEEDAGTIGTIECRVDDAWEVVGELEVPRHGLVVAARDGWLHVIGGGPEPRLTVSDVHEVIPIDTR
jgi:hypothetical protein